ncbi:MAG: tRNA lysidine(34) synthetase TilS [Ignavibacteria bacterium]|nr:tRNA lysidine(34) synthetase TilS [Ignavibacteria bacterium]
MNFIDKFSQVLAKEFLLKENSRLVIAVSGGIDSVTLLDSFSKVKENLNLELAIAHLNHRLRGQDSDLDEEFVKELASSYSLPCFCKEVDVRNYATSNNINIEEAGRILRYEFFVEVANLFGARYIATAHNMNDQAETVLMNIVRGCGLRGLRGIASERLIDRVTLIRPFLWFTRQEIELYARSSSLRWREDSSNLSLDFLRNRIRLKLIPFLEKEFNPEIVQVLNNFTDIARAAYEVVSSETKRIIGEHLEFHKNGEIKIPIHIFGEIDKYIISEVIENIVVEIFKKKPFSYKNIQAILNLIYSETGSYLKIRDDLVILKDRGNLTFLPKESWNLSEKEILTTKNSNVCWENLILEFEEVPIATVELKACPNVEFFDYDKIADQFVIRNWKKGDKFVPLGLKSFVKLSDFFVNQKIPLHKKRRIPICVSQGEIFWVVGLRISENFKVTNRTKRVLQGKVTFLDKDE